jgi:hypothetical protein
MQAVTTHPSCQNGSELTETITPVAPSHPPIHNIFDAPAATPAPTTIMSMSMPEEDMMSLSLPGIGEDADVGGGSLPPTPFVTANSTPTVGTARCCPPSDFVIACRHATINALVAGRSCR